MAHYVGMFRALFTRLELSSPLYLLLVVSVMLN